MKIGAQLYTVQKHIGTLEGFEASLKKIADMGYTCVQVGSGDYDPYWLRDVLQKYNLKCVMTHRKLAEILENTEQMVKNHEIFGCDHIGLGMMPIELQDSMEGYEEFKKMLLPAALKLRDMGAKFLYHNHRFEFTPLDGKDMLQRMLEDFPSDCIDFTLDLGWAAYAGADVLKLIEQLSGRISRVHLKDYTDVPEDGSIDTFTYLRPIYEGKLDYDAYLKALKKAGCLYALVEQDWCYDEDEFECLRRSYENVTKRFPDMK